jgi:plasmid maintenance system killer protein
MEVQFRDAKLDRLEIDPRYGGGFSQAVVTAFRKRMQMIRAAPDERVFYQLKSLHFEKLQGSRSHQHAAPPLPEGYALAQDLRNGHLGGDNERTHTCRSLPSRRIC